MRIDWCEVKLEMQVGHRTCCFVRGLDGILRTQRPLEGLIWGDGKIVTMFLKDYSDM